MGQEIRRLEEIIDRYDAIIAQLKWVLRELEEVDESTNCEMLQMKTEEVRMWIDKRKANAVRMLSQYKAENYGA